MVLNTSHVDNYSMRARRQVILMLGTVVLSFFLCLIPFRVFTLWIIIVPEKDVYQLGVEKYYNILYFCRIMVYLNSAINPILYNLMSSKFRTGFILCSETRRKFYFKRSRNGTFSTTVNSCRNSTFRNNSHDNGGGSKVCYRPRSNSILLKSCTINDSPNAEHNPRIFQNCIDEEGTDLQQCHNSNNYHKFVKKFDVNIYTHNHQKLFDSMDTNEEHINLHEKFLKRNKKLEEESFV